MSTYLKLRNNKLVISFELFHLIWPEGNFRAFGSNRIWCYFLVHTFKIKKFESISSNGSRDIGKSLKISFDSQYTPCKQKKPHSIISTRSWVLVYIRTDRQTFLKKFYFFLLIKNIYTCLYLSRLFLKFHTHYDQS